MAPQSPSTDTTLDLEDKGGMLRIGAAHYNTPAEIDRFLTELVTIAASNPIAPECLKFVTS